MSSDLGPLNTQPSPAALPSHRQPRSSSCLSDSEMPEQVQQASSSSTITTTTTTTTLLSSALSPSFQAVVAANEERIAAIIHQLDSALSLTPSSLSSSEHNPAPPSQEVASLPVPSVSVAMSNMSLQTPAPRKVSASRAVHDSGYGSSIQSSKNTGAAIKPSNANAGLGSSSASTVKKSAMTRTQRRLSEAACRVIKKTVFEPILRDQSVKAYHPIVYDAPKRMIKGQIICLRDLEKFLLFMASTTVKTAAVYQDFCILSINAIQTASEQISESEHTRPNDVPYSNGYFTDLVSQIRDYARTVSAQRQRRAAGEDVEEMETIRLHGGISQTGQPATLVREKKDGSLAAIGPEPKNDTGLSKDLIFSRAGVPDDGYTAYQRLVGRETVKREVPDEWDSEGEVYRSQARRMRQKIAERHTGVQSCADCGKTFARNCDLTKHQKTHSRPFKCPEPSCVYHSQGWPTEKEMERHYNDKHSLAPLMYKCKYDGCDYESKRESNCKQHMEKTHGWKYVRSKKTTKTGKHSASGSVSRSPASTDHLTPSSSTNYSTPRTPASHMHESPLVPMSHTFGTPAMTHQDSFDSSLDQSFDFNNYHPLFPDLNFDMNFTGLNGIPGAPMEGVDFNVTEPMFAPDLSSGSISPTLLMNDNPQLFTPQHSTEQRLFHNFDDDDLYSSPNQARNNQAAVNNAGFMYSPASQENGHNGLTFNVDNPIFDPAPFDPHVTSHLFPDLPGMNLESQGHIPNQAHDWLESFEQQQQHHHHH